MHLFKNFYNNFVNKNQFYCPDFSLLHRLEPKFNDIVKLHDIELGKSVKFAYKLNDKCLRPAPIERCNVSLAASVFHESTINALDHFSTDYPEFVMTANFLRIILCWWNTVNVKSRYIGERKRDATKEPVSLKNLDACEYLLRFHDWLQFWQTSVRKCNSLSKDTFEAASQTCKALYYLTHYLLNEKAFDYVLLGAIQSDCIERRFGCYRQLNGANYYASVCQFIESEKTIRLESLIKLSNLDLLSVKQIFSESNVEINIEIQEVADLLSELIEFELDKRFVSKDDKSILYYVAGYISRCITKSNTCANCRSLLVRSDDSPNFEFDTDCPQQYLNAINRGGLCTPSDIVFITTLHAHELFNHIFDDILIKEQLLASTNPRSIFIKVFMNKMVQNENTHGLSQITCESSHLYSDFMEKNSRIIFNIGSKNYVNELNSDIHSKRKRISKCNIRVHQLLGSK